MTTNSDSKNDSPVNTKKVEILTSSLKDTNNLPKPTKKLRRSKRLTELSKRKYSESGRCKNEQEVQNDENEQDKEVQNDENEQDKEVQNDENDENEQDKDIQNDSQSSDSGTSNVSESYVELKTASDMLKFINDIIKSNVGDKLPNELKIQYEKLKDEMDRDSPSLVKIMNACITNESKKHALYMYNIYTDDSVGPFVKLSLRDKINDIITTTLTEDELSIHKSIEIKMNKIHSPVNSIKNRIFMLNVDNNIKSIIYKMLLSLKSINPTSSTYVNIKKKLDIAVNLPYNTKSPTSSKLVNITNTSINKYCTDVRNKLDSMLYGMTNVKERLIEETNAKVTSPNVKGKIMCLCGPPGVGKTSIARAYATARGVPFYKISLGGMREPETLTGSDPVFLGSHPSIFLNILTKWGCNDGVILLDELDKLGNNGSKSNEVQYALLNVLDTSENHDFKDHFLNDFSHDLSNITFICSMNSNSSLHPALLDRMEIINVKPYKNKDLLNIITNYIFPKMLKSVGLDNGDIIVSDEAVNRVLFYVSPIVKTKGVRFIEKFVKNIIYRLNFIKTNTLEDGTMGDIKMSYSLPNFSVPYTITRSTIDKLHTKVPVVDTVPAHMYS